ncbi:hypothetical protein HUXLEY_190 [Erwinia phage vB_EamM_Huxley]|uniref:Uncharacterized protein n=1 Tax=Erwinia phage vB_EamM_Huxley TaxID=1883373 RepID=A0A1B2IDF6_9CAUD|nr:hypothetical protein BIZ81_gp093 [Erwinia phage vB_EamM_Huxley]ANZ49272.1 hypothetical protein HUXLEY_190 [Erwinia phage vB_EamM_Huxley]
MLQMHSYFDTAELERLQREGKLPVGLTLGSIQKCMSKGDGVLMLFRCARSWDVKAALVSLPIGETKNTRKVLTAFCSVSELPSETLYYHLESNHFASAEVHIPSSACLSDDFPDWVVYRHVRQAPGVPDEMRILEPGMVDVALGNLDDNERPERMEIFVARKAIKDVGNNMRGLIKRGFISRKFIYQISQ